MNIPYNSTTQTIRCVGGPYHGRTISIPTGQLRFLGRTISIPTGQLRFLPDGTLTDPCHPVETTVHEYFRAVLQRHTNTLLVQETVMLHESLRPVSDETLARWQELRSL